MGRGKKGQGAKASRDTEGFLECPECERKVKEKNIEAHLRKVHGLKPAEAKEHVRRMRERPSRPLGERKGVLAAIVVVVIVLVSIPVMYPFLQEKEDDGNGGDDEVKDYHKVDFVTEDGWKIFGDLYPPKGTTRPTLLLVHGMTENRNAYRSFAEEMYAQGHPVLMYDVRGHGESVTKDGQYSTTLTPEDIQDGTKDISAAIDYLSDRGATTNGVIMVGASVGANNAAVYGGTDPRVKAIVLLSPGDKYQGIEPMSAIKDYKKDVLFVASIGDDIAYESCIRFHDNATNARTNDFYTLPGIYHGTGMLLDEGLRLKVRNWIMQRA